jgi:hypothetical protein
MPKTYVDACKLFAQAAAIPSFKAASIAPNAFTAIVSQRDLGEKRMRNGLTTFHRDHEKRTTFRSPFSVDMGDVSAIAISPSGTMAAVVRPVDSKTILEIWTQDSRCPTNRKIIPGDKHGDVYADAQIGPLAWSADEKYLAFVAEASQTTAPAQSVTEYMQTEAKGADRLGSKFEHRFDLGEQFDGKILPKIFLADISKSISENEITVTAVPTPEHLAVGDPQLHGSASKSEGCDGLSIAYTGWELEPKRYGFVYCPIRPAAIYKQDLVSCSGDAGKDGMEWGEPICLTNDFEVAHSPRFSPDGSQLLFLGRYSCCMD